MSDITWTNTDNFCRISRTRKSCNIFTLKVKLTHFSIMFLNLSILTANSTIISSIICIIIFYPVLLSFIKNFFITFLQSYCCKGIFSIFYNHSMKQREGLSFSIQCLICLFDMLFPSLFCCKSCLSNIFFFCYDILYEINISHNITSFIINVKFYQKISNINERAIIT